MMPSAFKAYRKCKRRNPAAKTNNRVDKTATKKQAPHEVKDVQNALGSSMLAVWISSELAMAMNKPLGNDSGQLSVPERSATPAVAEATQTETTTAAVIR